MSQIIAFIRTNEHNLDYSDQQITNIKEYLIANKMDLSKLLKAQVNVPLEENNVLVVLEETKDGDTIVVNDINVFGRTIEAILDTINLLLNRGIRIISIKQNYDLIKNDQLTKMVLAIIDHTIKIEKELMSLRTKEALVAKKLSGSSLGKPKGTIQKSKFDDNIDKIKELLNLGLSVRKIAKLLGYSNHIGLNNYINKRGIKEELRKERGLL
jgi:putative DNA-invertase from lambdoid prophage Rac